MILKNIFKKDQVRCSAEGNERFTWDLAHLRKYYVILPRKLAKSCFALTTRCSMNFPSEKEMRDLLGI